MFKPANSKSKILRDYLWSSTPYDFLSGVAFTVYIRVGTDCRIDYTWPCHNFRIITLKNV